MRQIGQQLFLELWPIASGNHSHLGDGEEFMQEGSHLGIQRRFAFCQCAIQVKAD